MNNNSTSIITTNDEIIQYTLKNFVNKGINRNFNGKYLVSIENENNIICIGQPVTAPGNFRPQGHDRPRLPQMAKFDTNQYKIVNEKDLPRFVFMKIYLVSN